MLRYVFTLPLALSLISQTNAATIDLDQCQVNWCFDAVSAFVLAVEESFCNDSSSLPGKVVPHDLRGWCSHDKISAACRSIANNQAAPTTSTSITISTTVPGTETTSIVSTGTTSTSILTTSLASTSQSSTITSTSLSSTCMNPYQCEVEEGGSTTSTSSSSSSSSSSSASTASSSTSSVTGSSSSSSSSSSTSTTSTSSSSSSASRSSSSSASATPTGSSVVYKGADISSLLMLEEGLDAHYEPYGWQWTVDNNPPNLENLLKAGGVNIVRLRLWHTNDTNAPDAYGLQYNLKLAKRVVQAGLMVYLDIMYSDTWADPSHNYAPVAWQGYNQAQMEAAAVAYTSMVMEAFSAAQIPLEIVSIGNEITKGMLWPLGGNHTIANYAAVAPILHKASVAIKASSLSPTPKIMTHCDQGANLEVQLSWYKNMFSHGLDVSDIDLIGGTFYPFYSWYDTQGALTNTFTQLSQLYNKPCIVVETNWPISCPDPGWLVFASDMWAVVNKTSTGRFPFSAEGQRGWMQLVSQSLNQVPNRMGAGLFYWEPAWANNTGLGTPCDDNSMMTWDWAADSNAEGGYGVIGIADGAISVFGTL